MKICLLIFGILLAAPMGRTDKTARQLNSRISKDFWACRAGLGMPAVEEEFDQDSFDFYDPKYRCIQACVLTRLGLLKDMKLNIENMSFIFNELYGEEEARKKIKAHMDCIEEEKEKVFEDECEYTQKHNECTIAHIVKMGYIKN